MSVQAPHMCEGQWSPILPCSFRVLRIEPSYHIQWKVFAHRTVSLAPFNVLCLLIFIHVVSLPLHHHSHHLECLIITSLKITSASCPNSGMYILFRKHTCFFLGHWKFQQLQLHLNPSLLLACPQFLSCEYYDPGCKTI